MEDGSASKHVLLDFMIQGEKTLFFQDPLAPM
jgi:hypothetical protein